MTLEQIAESYPELNKRLPAQLFTVRELLVVDENYEEADGEETGEFEPSEYSHILYIAEPMQEILGEEGLRRLTEKIVSYEPFEETISTEKDLFGLQTALDEEQISAEIFAIVEGLLS